MPTKSICGPSFTSIINVPFPVLKDSLQFFFPGILNNRRTFSRQSVWERKGYIMVIYKAKNYQDLSRKAANIISTQIIMKPDCVLGLATGSSPVGTYKQLIGHKNLFPLYIKRDTARFFYPGNIPFSSVYFTLSLFHSLLILPAL